MKLSRPVKKIVKATIFGAFLVVVYGTIMISFPELVFYLEWKFEQKDFETVQLAAQLENQRVNQLITDLEKYDQTETFEQYELEGILENFLNQTTLNSTRFEFTWTRAACHIRMFTHAFMTNENTNLKFYHATTKLLYQFIRFILPIFATFAIGCATSALHHIVHLALRPIFNISKHEPLTVNRNRMLRRRDLIAFLIASVYFLLTFAANAFVMSSWLKCSFLDGIKRNIRFFYTIYPNVPSIEIPIDAYIFASIMINNNISFCFIFYNIAKLSHTWKNTTFTIPLIDQIAEAHRIDEEVQKMFRARKNANLSNVENN